MESPTTDAPLAVAIHREGPLLHWRVTNVSAAPVWAFLLVPTPAEGSFTFATDAAWLEAEGELIVARKVDAQVPEGPRHLDPIPSGAVELAPGATRTGALAIAEEMEVGGAYAAHPERRRVVSIVLEVGWVPVRAGQPAERLTWAGQPFAYLQTLTEPGGQRYVRSAPLRWRP
ncbi:MAG TPA: hypothetical protein PKI03_23240 [Pseudomonadota bacterium]|nr:hypothetical protein [Pseudomonadota bacterium]